ncbi:MAG: DUF3291 domain-containing protein [Bacteroidia bacterium]
MIITITSIRLRSLWQFFKLSWNGLQITRQMQQQKGFIRMKNTGLGYMHYTLSAWESEADMKAFMRSGAHAEAMKESANIATELATYTYEGDTLPEWKEAKQVIAEKGKVLRF